MNHDSWVNPHHGDVISFAASGRCATHSSKRYPLSRTSIGLGVLCALLLLGCKQRQNSIPTKAQDHGTFAVTPEIISRADDMFEDVTARAGIKFVQQFCDKRIANILESNGSGAVVLDFDNDGRMDIYIVNPGPLDGVTHHAPGTKREPNRLFRNKGDGTFEDVTTKAGVGGHGYAFTAAAADYDNDSFTDLYVVNIGKNILYRNRGDGTFEDVTDKAGVGDKGTGIGAVWFDYDRDGRLDLFVANYLTYDPNYNLYFNPDSYPGPLSYKAELNVLYHNKGDGTFENVSEASGIRIAGHRGMAVCAFDVNEDGFDDLYICNDATPNVLLLNDGKGHFQDVAVKSMVAFNAQGEAAGSMAAAIGDYNGDQHLDILVSRLGYGSLYTAAGGGMFDDRMVVSGVGRITAQYVGWASHLLDVDNDGDLDAIVVNGDPHHMVGWESLLLENNGDGTFTDAAEKGGAYFKTKIRGRGGVVADFDNDGRVDLLVTTIADRAILLRNRSPQTNHWVTLDLEGTKSNRDGFGARITISAGGKKQVSQARCVAGFLGTSDRRVHFGLGAARRIDSIEIRWPGGTVQKLENVAADKILKVRES